LFDFGALSPARNVMSISSRCHPFATHSSSAQHVASHAKCCVACERRETGTDFRRCLTCARLRTLGRRNPAPSSRSGHPRRQYRSSGSVDARL